MLIHLSEILDKAKTDRVGSQLRHCMVAVAKKKNGDAKAAWNICRWNLTRYGYMKKPYRKDAKATPSRLRLTRKGSRANMRHSSEPDVDKKNREFKKLMKKLDKDV